MNKPVGDILESELTATGPQVAIGVPVALKVAVDCGHQSEAPDVKLSVLVKKRLFDVLLNDVTSLYTIDSSVLYKSLNMIQVFAHLNSTSSVGILSRFNDPELFSKLG